MSADLTLLICSATSDATPLTGYRLLRLFARETTHETPPCPQCGHRLLLHTSTCEVAGCHCNPNDGPSEVAE